MDAQKSTYMTIKEATAHHGVSDKTIRRWIKQGPVNAKQITGRWHVQPDQDNVQATAPPNDQSSVQPPEPNTTR